jgi:hypothetical protein
MTHDQIREMVRRVNPVPDPNGLESVVTSVPVTRLERRTDMQTDSREVREEGGRSRWRGPLIGIAAAVAVLIAGSIYLLTRDNTPVAEPAPNAAPIPSTFEEAPLAPGAYFVDTDGDEASTLRGTFVIEGSGWTDVPSGVRKIFAESFVALLVVEVDEVWPSICEPTAPVAAGATAADLANQFATNGLTVREALAPVSAFGQNGYHLVGEVPAGCGSDVKPAWTGPVFNNERWYDPPEVVEYWFLDVEGTVVMIEASWLPGSSPEEDVAELEEVLNTLVITP